ncbi:amidohydrolase family protein [Microbacterium halotolerans]|uniref:amidohydrolase family protein n=1 Tax=Microbacterium halotolerans TaxID=246613 RepID=UPI000E6AD0C0|nr:amidohydrolase family protein [Microbacterium halotolerans]
MHDPLIDGGEDLPPVLSLKLADWQPRAQLELPTTAVERPAAPAIDVHNHLGRWLTDDWCAPDVGALIDLMDETAVGTIVNLDGRWEEELEANLDRYDRAHPDRFLTFCQLDWDLLGTSGGAAVLERQLRESADRGARGVKVWKNLGLSVRGRDDALVRPDAPEVVDILGAAGELGLPVLIHVADPRAFFEPLDHRNERFDELSEQPQWSFADRSRFPSFDDLLTSFERLLAATPRTQYIGAHMGCVAEDLDRVERMLDAAPNLSIDIAGRLAELGRQPRRFRRLVERHPDRVLFGTDAFPLHRGDLTTHFRFLETDDESFDYAPGSDVPPQGRWSISAADLPRRLLPGVYADNARRVLGLCDAGGPSAAPPPPR